MGKPESIVEKHLTQKAKELGFLCYKTKALGRKGFPDRTLIKNGLVAFIECKAQNGVQSEMQKEIQKELQKQNGLYFVVNSVASVNEILNVLNDISQSTHQKNYVEKQLKLLHRKGE